MGFGLAKKGVPQGHTTMTFWDTLFSVPFLDVFDTSGADVFVFEAAHVPGAAADGTGHHERGRVRFPDLVRIHQSGKIQVFFAPSLSFRRVFLLF